MEKQIFYKQMLRTAFCVSACDGEIHELEIDEIKKIGNTKPFFGDLDIENELNDLLSELKKKGRFFFSDYFNNLENQEIDEVQKLLIFEITLNIIYADKNLDDNEVKFLRALRKRLNIDENLILDRFGDVKALGIEKNQEYENLSASDLAEAFVFEELEELKLGKSTSES